SASFEEMRTSWLSHELRARPRDYDDYSARDKALMIGPNPSATAPAAVWSRVRFGKRGPLIEPLERGARDWRLMLLQRRDYEDMRPIRHDSWTPLARPRGSIADATRYSTCALRRTTRITATKPIASRVGRRARRSRARNRRN